MHHLQPRQLVAVAPVERRQERPTEAGDARRQPLRAVDQVQESVRRQRPRRRQREVLERGPRHRVADQVPRIQLRRQERQLAPVAVDVQAVAQLVQPVGDPVMPGQQLLV
ncbi:MAG TPA: hypothetical protein VM734_04780, partial [Kofleriaceae bacterium]|nr:hypothetical protein [Kofleriaceae bacterium]